MVTYMAQSDKNTISNNFILPPKCAALILCKTKSPNAKMEQNKIKTLKNNNSMNKVFCFHRQWKNQRERSVMRNKTDGFIRWEWENCITLSLHFLISPVLSLCPQLYVHYYTVVNLIKFREEGDRLSLLASVWLANSKRGYLLNAESLEVKQTKQQQSQQSQTRTTYLVVLVSLVKKHCAHTHTHKDHVNVSHSQEPKL